MSDELTDQGLTAAAEVIIDRVAALRPDHDYETNGLVWAVASYAVGLQSIIDEVRAERDRLRAELDTANAELEDAHRFERDARQVEDERDRLRVELADTMATGQSMEGQCNDLAAERDRFDAALRLVYFHLGPPQPRVLDPAEVAGLVERAMAERDRLRERLDAERQHRIAAVDREVEATNERDRLRAVVDAQAVSLARLKEFAESEILDRVSTELGARLRGQLDVSPDIGGGDA